MERDGRHEHDAIDHMTPGHEPVAEHAQPSIPRRVQGCPAGSGKCECHDFHDTAVAASDADGRLELAAGAPAR